jgi:hypothetical protein
VAAQRENIAHSTPENKTNKMYVTGVFTERAEQEMENVSRASGRARKLNLIPRVCSQHKRNLNYCLKHMHVT